ncbi:unnamed protein product [Scytosiphon promiscuus]
MAWTRNHCQNYTRRCSVHVLQTDKADGLTGDRRYRKPPACRAAAPTVSESTSRVLRQPTKMSPPRAGRTNEGAEPTEARKHVRFE